MKSRQLLLILSGLFISILISLPAFSANPKAKSGAETNPKAGTTQSPGSSKGSSTKGAGPTKKPVPAKPDLYALWEARLTKWKTKTALLSYLRKSNFFLSSLNNILDDQALADFYKTLHAKTFNLASFRVKLSTVLKPLSPKQLDHLIWSVVAEEGLKVKLTGLSAKIIADMATPMDAATMWDMVQEEMEKAGTKKSGPSDEGGPGAPGKDKGDSYYDGMYKPGIPKDKGNEGLADNSGTGVDAGSKMTEAVGSGSGSSAMTMHECMEKYLSGKTGGKSFSNCVAGGCGGNGEGGDPSPETTPEGAGGNWGSGSGGQPIKNPNPGENAIGFGGGDCEALNPSMVYDSTGGGVGQKPPHQQGESYGWSFRAKVYEYQQKYDKSGNFVSEKKVPVGYKDVSFQAGGGGSSGVQLDKDGNVKQVYGTQTTQNLDLKGNPIGEPQSESTGAITPQENEQNYKDAKKESGGSGNVTKDTPPKNADGTPSGQKYNPDELGGKCGDALKYCSGLSDQGGLNNPDDCVDKEWQGKQGIVELDSSAADNCDKGNGEFFYELVPLWDPVPMMEDAGTLMNKGPGQTGDPAAKGAGKSGTWAP